MKKCCNYVARAVLASAACLAFAITAVCAADRGNDDTVRITLPDGTVKTMDLATYEAYFGPIAKTDQSTNQTSASGARSSAVLQTRPSSTDLVDLDSPQRQNNFATAKTEDAETIYRRAYAFYSKKEYDKAITLFTQAADLGSAGAQNYMAYIYYTGEGAPKDYVKAFQWYDKAARQGYDIAQRMLGEMYRDAEGVGQDYQQAAVWFRKAADQGNAKAQWQLAELYRDGKGVAQDSARAAEWYRKSAEQGNAVAQVNLGYLYRAGRGVPQDNYQAVQWYLKAAEQGNSAAQNNLGFMYRNGYGVPQNFSEAEQWYLKAVAQNNEDARQNLAKLYEITGRNFNNGRVAAISNNEKPGQLYSSQQTYQEEVEAIQREAAQEYGSPRTFSRWEMGTIYDTSHIGQDGLD